VLAAKKPPDLVWRAGITNGPPLPAKAKFIRAECYRAKVSRNLEVGAGFVIIGRVARSVERASESAEDDGYANLRRFLKPPEFDPRR